MHAAGWKCTRRVTDTETIPAGVQSPQQDHTQVTCNNTPTFSIQTANLTNLGSMQQPHHWKSPTRDTHHKSPIQGKGWSWTISTPPHMQPYPPHGAPQILFQVPWDNLSIQSPLSHPSSPSCLGWSHNWAAGSWFLGSIPAPSPDTGVPCEIRSRGRIDDCSSPQWDQVAKNKK